MKRGSVTYEGTITMNRDAYRKLMATQFCQATVPLWGDLAFFIDGNSKITRDNGTYAEPAPNAFSLPAASVDGLKHCPGSTPTCRDSCYVRGLAGNAPDLYARYADNARVLDAILPRAHLPLRAAKILGRWISEHAPHGFRWHVSGDARDMYHAAWIVDVCRESPDVSHWIYTRTLDAVRILVQARNLAVNVSADADNWVGALACAAGYGARVCYMASEDGWVPMLDDGDVIFPDYALRGSNLADPTEAPWWQGLTPRKRAMVCPADFFGQSEQHRCGPCRKCFR